MPKQITKTVSLHDEDLKNLNLISERTGLNASEIFRMLIKKAVDDPVELTIIIKKFLDQEGTKIAKERLLRIMSNRRTLKKEEPTQRGSSEGCPNPRLDDSINNYHHATQEEIEIAKTPWVDEYEN